MNRIVLATTAVIALTSAASAADMRAPVYKAPVAAPIYNWSGFYLGVNAGLGVGEHASEYNTLPPGLLTNDRFTASPIGAIGGVQAGYNWQFGNWVLGLEADIQASGQKDGDHCLLQCVPGNLVTIEQTLSWFGTVRGRVGYSSAGGVMAYYTGGLAYGGVETTFNETTAAGTGSFKFSDTKTGWTLGSGVEAALGGNWTGKIEYLYIDLGTQEGTYFLGAPRTISHDLTSHVFRGGLNYRFGGSMLAPLPLANWTGFYVGANIGSGLGRFENNLSAPLVPVNERFNSVPSGILGGAQAGYNWQAGNLVFGLEADFQGSAQDDKVCTLICNPALGFFAAEQSLPWFGTVRGRVGYATGPTLFYLTGGLAYGKVESDITEFVGAVTASRTFSETKTGWVLGGGVERPFDFFGLIGGPNWSIKAEYLYIDLGEITNTYTQIVPHTFTTDATSHVFRTGINYHFNAGPVVAKY